LTEVEARGFCGPLSSLVAKTRIVERQGGGPCTRYGRSHRLLPPPRSQGWWWLVGGVGRARRIFVHSLRFDVAARPGRSTRRARATGFRARLPSKRVPPATAAPCRTEVLPQERRVETPISPPRWRRQ